MTDLPHVILASKSPRRRELLSLAGIRHTVLCLDADEGCVEYHTGEPERFALDTARIKSDFARSSFKSGAYDDFLNIYRGRDTLLLTADTVVYCEVSREIFGKPADLDDAKRMLRLLSGAKHRVITGVVISDIHSGREVSFCESTDVFFRDISDGEILSYIENYPPYDKAGAYGIQDGACVFVERIDGDYPNVVGLPVCRLCKEISGFDFSRP